MKSFVLAIVIVAVAAGANANPLIKSPEECINGFRAKLEAVVVPKDVEVMVGRLEDLNRVIFKGSLTKMLDDQRCEKDIYRTGIISQGEAAEKLAEVCSNFIQEVTNSMKVDGCQDVADMELDTYFHFIDLTSQDPKLDKAIGSAQACFFV